MKQHYTTPAVSVVSLTTEGMLATSRLSQDGGQNIDITISGNDPVDNVEFRSSQHGWSAENWCGE